MQLNVGLGPNALKLFEYYSLVFLCLSAPSHKDCFKPESLKQFESFLVRGRTKTQKYKRVIFEQFESVCA